MRLRFRLRTMFLAVFVIAALLCFFTPVAGINSATCNRIMPGMTEQQASDIVGAPPGWYDGVGGIRSNAPSYKGDYSPSWVGLRGEIVVDLDESGRVARATFYSADIFYWSPTDYLWERFTRVKYMGLTLPARVLLFIGLAAIATFMLGMAILQADAKNGIASHGLMGMVLGATFAVAVFSDGFFSDLLVTFLALSGPIVGAFAGMAVGCIRGLFVRLPARRKLHVSKRYAT